MPRKLTIWGNKMVRSPVACRKTFAHAALMTLAIVISLGGFWITTLLEHRKMTSSEKACGVFRGKLVIVGSSNKYLQ
jgi:hypothetical protein